MTVTLTTSTTLETVMETRGLTKLYHDRAVVHGLNLHVRRGEIYGFLGPNGAGKTTTIRMLLGLIPPTRGDVHLFGQTVTSNSIDARRRLGVVSEQPYIYEDLTAMEYLLFFARLNRVADAKQRALALLERLGLAPYHNLLARDFSRGMQQKLSLVRALLHSPELLILDEPVSGLDPHGILQVREVLEDERRAGRTIFLSSHILSEIERIANRVGIVHHGRLVLEESVEAIQRSLSSGLELEIELETVVPGLEQRVAHLEGVREVQLAGSILTIDVEQETNVRAVISQTIAAAGGVIVGMQARRASLEDAFVTLTHGSLDRLVSSDAAARTD